MSLAAAIAIGSGGATAYADPPPPTVPGSTPEATTDAIGQFHLIRLANTNLCIQALNRSNQDVVVVLSQCDPSAPAQNWIFSRQASGDYEILNPNGKCLYVNGGSTANVEIIQSECNGFGSNVPVSNALWKPSSLTGFATLMSRIGHRNSGLCIDTFGNAFDGIGMRTFGCDGSPAQVFVVGQE